MKLCLFNEAGSFGGAEVHTLLLIESLTRRGHSVLVVECGGQSVLKDRAEARLGSAASFVTTPLSTDTTSPRQAATWIKFLRALRADRAILIKNWNRRGSALFLAALRLSCPQVAFIEHLEADPAPRRAGSRYFGVLPRPGLWVYYERLRRWLPSLLANRVVAVSDKVRKRLIEDCHYPARKVTVARNGVAWREFTRDTEAGMAFRDRHGIARECRLMILLARLEHAKGIDLALRALAAVRGRTSVPVHLLIAGSGSLESQLKSLAGELGLGGAVTFAGFLSDPRPALWAGDVILFSSRLEGLPLGLLEGMAAGCVPIVTRISGMPEVVTSPELGWVVEPESPEALAAAITRMSALDSTQLSGLRARAVAHIQQEFDLQRSQERLLVELGV